MQTNNEYRKDNRLFRAACYKANIAPTQRQASKFRRGTGIAYKVIQSQAKPLTKGDAGFFDWED